MVRSRVWFLEYILLFLHFNIYSIILKHNVHLKFILNDIYIYMILYYHLNIIMIYKFSKLKKFFQ